MTKDARKRKLASSGSFRRNSVNDTKARNNILIMQANKTIVQVQEIANDPNKVIQLKTIMMREKTLIKQICLIYQNFQKIDQESAIEFHLQLYKYQAMNFSHSQLVIKNYKSVSWSWLLLFM